MRFNKQWHIQSDIDAIGSKYGHAIDFGMFVQYRLHKNWTMGVGYRTVEGGADVDVVYNFAWLHYAGLRLQANY
ncbi:MAG: hypothetical protein OEZ43_12585 [Gammaproteobacteria bacterium]|nr:hypothetical protein [Gammaproteobacteria bacterium]